MKSIIENAVSSAFSAIASLTVLARYIVVAKSGFVVNETETYLFHVMPIEDETNESTYERSNRVNVHDLKIIYETKTLAVEAKHGDKIELVDKTYEIVEPVGFDPIKATTTLQLKRIS